MIYGNISTRPMCARAALATTRLGKPNIRFHQIMMVMTTVTTISPIHDGDDNDENDTDDGEGGW